jgi:hypothetical protein
MSPHDAALLQQALDQVRTRPPEADPPEGEGGPR